MVLFLTTTTSVTVSRCAFALGPLAVVSTSAHLCPNPTPLLLLVIRHARLTDPRCPAVSLADGTLSAGCSSRDFGEKIRSDSQRSPNARHPVLRSVPTHFSCILTNYLTHILEYQAIPVYLPLVMRGTRWWAQTLLWTVSSRTTPSRGRVTRGPRANVCR